MLADLTIGAGNLAPIFLLSIGLGLIPAFIAKNKGYNFALFWVFGALFFLIALIVSLVISPKGGSPARFPGAASLAPCPFCAEAVQSNANICRHCGRDLPKRPCPTCAHPIVRTASMCATCSRISPAWQLYEGRWFSTDATGTEYVLDPSETAWQPTGRVHGR